MTTAPKTIEADGQTYVACRGLVRLTPNGRGWPGGSETFQVTFTDARGRSRTLRGVRRVTIDVPKTVPAPMPLTPRFTTSEGKQDVESDFSDV